MRLIRIDRKFIDNRWICYFHICIFLCILNVSFCCKQIHFTIQAGIVICIEINITLLYLNVNMLSVQVIWVNQNTLILWRSNFICRWDADIAFRIIQPQRK
ncbi:Uncharacterised protein [uncultured Clostridium sp.]|nr:Uncharacterised protein [uncultured Clostridium sp.]